MNNDSPQKLLNSLKKLDFSEAQATFWIVKRTGKPNSPTFSTLYVNTEAALQKKLASIVRNAIEQANRVSPYDYDMADMDEEEALVLKVDETGFEQIQATADLGSNAPQVQKAEELSDSWAYLIDVNAGGKHVRAVRKIVGGWALKKRSLTVKVLFSKTTLMDYEDAPVFQLERKVDFLAFEDFVFVLDKSKFESVMNFRAGMERKKDELLADLGERKLLSDVDLVRNTIGTNINLLRRAASVKKNGYYENDKFVEELRQICDQHGWNVKWQDGHIIVTPDNVGIILTLLNNDRLQSPVNAEWFDALVKNRVK
jgi:hypothetical protein